MACDNATVRPHKPPLVERGLPGQFQPFEVPRREPEVRDLPDSPLDLFQRYLPHDMAKCWADWSNGAKHREGPLLQHSRAHAWVPTSAEEIYLFVGILLYMGIHPESKISQYWSSSQEKEDPIHPFTQFITRNQFQLLLRRIRIFNTTLFNKDSTSDRSQQQRYQPRKNQMPKVYRQVNQWSTHIQEVGDSFFQPSSHLTVNEAIVRFTGRSLETTTIPSKPTPVRYKVWVLDQSGYFLRWLWHVHGKGPYGLVPQQRPRCQGNAEEALEHLTPTQRVVTTLITLLPVAIYHVFLDNLFASINQMTWKDNALVLFLTTVYRETEEVVRNRRRPAGSSAANRAAREVFGPDARKQLPIPLGIDEYNHNMNGVDTGDQMRSYSQYGRPIRRGGWQAITFNFLLEVVVVSSFLLQLWGESNWLTVKTLRPLGNCPPAEPPSEGDRHKERRNTVAAA
ncbi:hypothetical protein LZ32DRAFT_633571 [Colletotrichum eremochloae]|nr:hypothetical protein LZ32DRAFT_633571 [Colletotrichum eremochloae]